MISFTVHPFLSSRLVVTAQLWSIYSKFLTVSLLLPVYLFCTFIPIQVRNHCRELYLLFEKRCLKYLRIVSLSCLQGCCQACHHGLVVSFFTLSVCFCLFVCLFVCFLPCLSVCVKTEQRN